MTNLKLAALNESGRTLVPVDSLKVGEGFTIIAGPCTVESEKQTIETAIAVKKAGAHALRGGAFKPRSSPYAFQGLGLKGLQILRKAKAETGLPIVTEVVDSRDVFWVSEYADVLQIGARNMQNFSLLKEVGRSERPVLLKRGHELHHRGVAQLRGVYTQRREPPRHPLREGHHGPSRNIRGIPSI